MTLSQQTSPRDPQQTLVRNFTPMKLMLVHGVGLLMEPVNAPQLLQTRLVIASCGFTQWACPSVCPSICRQNAYTKTRTRFFSKTKQFRAISPTSAFQRTHYWTAKIHNGEDPPSWKSSNRHISTKIMRFQLKLVHNSWFGTRWQSRDQIWIFKI